MPDADGPAACPTCKRPVDAKRRCWRCCDRACSACGKPTGSAFIELCVACGQAHGRAEEVPVPAPAPAKDQWAAVFEPMPDAVPFVNRVRRLLKYAVRSCKLRCAALHLPDGARIGEVIEGEEQA